MVPSLAVEVPCSEFELIIPSRATLFDELIRPEQD
jgi:hypothetical protein